MISHYIFGRDDAQLVRQTVCNDGIVRSKKIVQRNWRQLGRPQLCSMTVTEGSDAESEIAGFLAKCSAWHIARHLGLPYPERGATA